MTELTIEDLNGIVEALEQAEETNRNDADSIMSDIVYRQYHEEADKFQALAEKIKMIIYERQQL